MYNHIIWVDELWDIIEDGVTFPIDAEEMVVDRKSMTEAQIQIYRKHHVVHDILMEALPHLEYTKIVDKLISARKCKFMMYFKHVSLLVL